MSNDLQHHGILGMKWGVRRFQNKDGTLTPAGRKRAGKSSPSQEAHEDYKKARVNKSVKAMSNTELRDRISRFQMEKQYSQLTRKEKSRGAKIVTSVLTEAAKQTAGKYVSKYMTQGVDRILEKLVNYRLPIKGD